MKWKVKYANRKLAGCLYDLRIKVDKAVNYEICYTEVSKVDVASWKLIDCLVEHKNDEDDDMNADMLEKFINSRKKNKLKQSRVIAKYQNNKIDCCINELMWKVEEAQNKDIHFNRVHGVNEVSCKLINCLIEDQLKTLTNDNQGSHVASNVQETRRRIPISSGDCKTQLDFNDKDDIHRNLCSRYIDSIQNKNEADRKMQELTETIQDQNQENRNLIVKLEELDKEKNNLEKKLRLTRSYYKGELERKNEDLKVLERKLLRAEEKFENMRIRVRDADIELNKLKSILQNAMFKSLELAAELNCEGSMSDIAENTEKLKQEEICKKKKDIALTEQLMGARISEHHITYNIRANAVQISDNGSIVMSRNSSVDKDRLQCDLDEPENQQHLEIEN